MDPPFINPFSRKVKFNGHYEIFYTQKTEPGKHLHIPGRHVDKRGFVCDKDGYICVRTTLVKMEETIKTSIGMGKRYDTSNIANTVEIYTNW